MNLNRIDLIGRTTQKPELKTTSSDRKICIFTLAVNGYKNKNGEVHVDFIKCILSGIGAETFVKYVEKGTKVRVSGSLTVSRSEKDGKTYENTVVSVSDFEFLDHAKNSEKKETQESSNKVAPTEFAGQEVSDDDLPF